MYAEEYEDRRHGRHESAWERGSSRFMDYVRSRRSDHWIMFLAGLVLGLILG